MIAPEKIGVMQTPARFSPCGRA